LQPSPKKSNSLPLCCPDYGIRDGGQDDFYAGSDQPWWAAVNVVSGWFKGEFHAFCEPWLDHDERYRRSEEFIRVLKQMWSEEETVFSRRFLPD